MVRLKTQTEDDAGADVKTRLPRDDGTVNAVTQTTVKCEGRGQV